MLPIIFAAVLLLPATFPEMHDFLFDFCIPYVLKCENKIIISYYKEFLIMKYSTKLSDTVHVMVLIAINQEKSLDSSGTGKIFQIADGENTVHFANVGFQKICRFVYVHADRKSVV